MGKTVGRRPQLEKGNRDAPRGRHDRDLRGLSGANRPWEFVNSSRSPRARVFARSRISPRSRGRRLRSRCSSRSRRAAAATITATSRCVVVAVATSGCTASSISSATSTASPATVATIEYDPNRSARIALVTYADGEKRYILHPKGCRVGDTIVSRARARTSGPATRCRSREMPLGTAVHNIELKIGKGGQMAARRACRRQVVAKEGEYVTLRMPSTRDAAGARHAACATIGDGRQRRARAALVGQGRQDALDGSPSEGARRSHEPGRPPARRSYARRTQRRSSPWGKKEGVKTRNKKKSSQRLIVRGRKRGKATQ